MAIKNNKKNKKVEEQPKAKPIIWIKEPFINPNDQKKKKNNKK